MILNYEAIDNMGHRSSDVLEANNTTEAVQALRRRGLFVTHIAESSGRKIRGVDTSPTSHNAPLPHRCGLPLKILALFTRQMAMLLRAGSGLVPALASIRRQFKKPPQTAILSRLIEDLEDGITLTDALRKHPHTFDPVYCAIVAAGEASGSLAPMFDRLSKIVGTRRALRKKIIGAMTYPALLIFMSGHILLVLLLFVLPRFADMFVQLGVDPPSSTLVLLAVGTAVRGYWPLILTGVAAMGLSAILALRTQRGRQWACDMQLRIPVIGGLRSRLIQAQIFRTIGTLLESRVGLLDTLDLARKSTRNSRFQHMFTDLENQITSGGQLTAVLEASGLVEAPLCQAIRTGEDSGSLGEAFVYGAEILDESNEELITVVMRLAEPVILIGMGVVVGAVAIALFLPLFDLTSAI